MLGRQSDVEVVGYDLGDPQSVLDEGLKTADVIFHLAGVNRPERPEDYAVGNAEIRAHMQLKDRGHLRERYIGPALEQGLIEYTLPAKPTSPNQKYRITTTGRRIVIAWRDIK